MRILHISDLHYRESPENWSLLKEAGRQFEMLRPDYSLITGDLTNDGLDERAYGAIERADHEDAAGSGQARQRGSD